MSALVFNLTGDHAIEQGATLRRQFRWKPGGLAAALTGYKARMQVRATLTSTTPLLDLTTENGGIEIDEAEGIVTLTATDEQTSAYAWRRGVYDIELESPGGDVSRFLKGEIEVDPEVTRAGA